MRKMPYRLWTLTVFALCIWLLSFSEPEPLAPIPWPVSSGNASEEELLDEIEGLLNYADPFDWLTPELLGEARAGTAPDAAFAVGSLAVLGDAHRRGVSIDTTEDGCPCFRPGDFAAASKELFGCSYLDDFEALAARQAGLAPEGMLRLNKNFGMYVNVDLLDRDTAVFGPEECSVWVDHYLFAYGDYVMAHTRRQLVFKRNPAYRFFSIQLVSFAQEG